MYTSGQPCILYTSGHRIVEAHYKGVAFTQYTVGTQYTGVAFTRCAFNRSFTMFVTGMLPKIVLQIF